MKAHYNGETYFHVDSRVCFNQFGYSNSVCGLECILTCYGFQPTQYQPIHMGLTVKQISPQMVLELGI